MKHLSVQRAELARGPFQVEGSARIQALVPVQVALRYVREATEEVVGGLHAYASQFADAGGQAAAAGEDQDLDAEDREELGATSALVVGQLDGAIDPEVRPMPMLAALVVSAVRASQELRDLNDEAGDL